MLGQLFNSLPSNMVWKRGSSQITQSRGMTGIAKLGMKMAASDVVVNHENETSDKKTSDSSVKVICLGDSAVGKSK